MSRMSEMYDDLTSIHQILLGARKLAVHGKDMTSMNADVNPTDHGIWTGRLAAIEDLILEFEAAGVEWPDNVVDGPWAASLDYSGQNVSQGNGPLGRTVTTLRGQCCQSLIQCLGCPKEE